MHAPGMRECSTSTGPPAMPAGNQPLLSHATLSLGRNTDGRQEQQSTPRLRRKLATIAVPESRALLRCLSLCLCGMLVRSSPWPSPPPCNRTWVIVHRRPDRMEADMTNPKPSMSNCVSPFTSSVRPSDMTPTTIARCQLGLQAPYSVRLEHKHLQTLLARSLTVIYVQLLQADGKIEAMVAYGRRTGVSEVWVFCCRWARDEVFTFRCPRGSRRAGGRWAWSTCTSCRS